MRIHVQTVIVLAVLAILAAAALSMRAARTGNDPVDEPRLTQPATSDPGDAPPIYGLQ
jgi:hypothetical protein